MWCAFGVVGQVVLAFDSAVDGGEAHLVAVVRRCPLVVDDAERVVLRLAGILAICEAVNTVANIVSGAFDSFLDEVGVQAVRVVAQFVVDGGFSFALARYAVVCRVAP